MKVAPSSPRPESVCLEPCALNLRLRRRRASLCGSSWARGAVPSDQPAPAHPDLDPKIDPLTLLWVSQLGLSLARHKRKDKWSCNPTTLEDVRDHDDFRPCAPPPSALSHSPAEPFTEMSRLR
jgi:hypothetical protein